MAKTTQTGELKLFSLTWPIFLEIFLFMLMGIADTLMLSRVSDAAVAGVGAANQYVQIAILVLEVVGIGASIVVSQYLGSKRMKEASQISALAITLNTLAGLVMSIVFLFSAQWMMQAMNLHGEVLAHATLYLSIVGGAIFLQGVINAISAIIRVHGFTQATMYVALGMNGLHIVLNYILIFGAFGAPALGVQGAAISSVVSRAVALVVFFYLLYRLMEVRITWKDYVTWSTTYISKILQVGIPAAFEEVIYQACQIVFLYYITFVGESSLAARQYAGNISMFTYLFALAIAMGTAIIVGRYVGANQKDIAYHQLWRSLRQGMIFTLVSVTLVIAFRTPLMELFTSDPEVIRIGAQVILLGIFLETGRTMNIVIIASLRAAGDARFPVFMAVISMVGISLPVGYFLVFHMHLGLVGVYLAIILDEWIRALFMAWRWKSRIWERYALVSPDKTKGVVEE